MSLIRHRGRLLSGIWWSLGTIAAQNEVRRLEIFASFEQTFSLLEKQTIQTEFLGPKGNFEARSFAMFLRGKVYLQRNRFASTEDEQAVWQSFRRWMGCFTSHDLSQAIWACGRLDFQEKPPKELCKSMKDVIRSSLQSLGPLDVSNVCLGLSSFDPEWAEISPELISRAVKE